MKMNVHLPCTQTDIRQQKSPAHLSDESVLRGIISAAPGLRKMSITSAVMGVYRDRLNDNILIPVCPRD